jgi:CHC2 zinc finger
VPGIDFARVRCEIPLADVLNLIGFAPFEIARDQVRGPCPVHRASSARSRSFSANVKRHIYKCFKCGSAGNQLDLYAKVTGLSLLEATIDLCRHLHSDVPWIHLGERGLAKDSQVPLSTEHADVGDRASRDESHSPEGLEGRLPSTQLNRLWSGRAQDSSPVRVDHSTECHGSRRNR